jgi:hypothetical protein
MWKEPQLKSSRREHDAKAGRLCLQPTGDREFESPSIQRRPAGSQKRTVSRGDAGQPDFPRAAHFAGQSANSCASPATSKIASRTRRKCRGSRSRAPRAGPLVGPPIAASATVWPTSSVEKQVAALTGIRTRCSNCGHGRGVHRQKRRAAVGLGQAARRGRGAFSVSAARPHPEFRGRRGRGLAAPRDRAVEKRHSHQGQSGLTTTPTASRGASPRHHGFRTDAQIARRF